MTIVEATKNWFKGWNTDKGCMSREEYWLGFVGFFIINSIFIYLARLYNTSVDTFTIISALTFIIYFFNLFVIINATTRRLHDSNKSAWSIFFFFFSIIGEINLIIMLCSPSIIENNKYRIKDSKKEVN